MNTTVLSRAVDDSLCRDMQLGARVSSVLTLVGARAYDRHLLPGDDAPRIASLEGVLLHGLDARAVWVADPQRRTVTLRRAVEGFASGCKLPSLVGETHEMSVAAALLALYEVQIGHSHERVCLLIDAHLLLEDVVSPRGEDFELVRSIERLARDRDPSRLLALRVTRPSELASAWKDSPYIRQVTLPQAARDERFLYAMLRLRGLELSSPGDQSAPVEDLANTVAACTEDWTLTEIENLITTAREKKVTNQQQLEELATGLRLGTTATPWSGEIIRSAVRDARQRIGERVLGQPQAMDGLVDFLTDAAAGLSVQGRKTQAPRGVKLLAGPSGVGKTEAAKASAELIYGQEQLLRFDLGEFQQEHSLARLIGAPPGYIGHGSGGELTEGVRRKPNSVVLLDEVEKASPRLWDALLGVFDDGRMTDGQGQVTFFGQSLILMTTNLGMHPEVMGADGRVQRVPRFSYDTPYEDLQRGMRQAIQEELAGRLGRPELLGRLGGAEAIIVFDFLRDPLGVARKFSRSVADDCRSKHGVGVVFGEDVLQLCAERFLANRDGLILGARSLAQELKQLAVTPLGRYVLHNDVRGRTLKLAMVGGEVSITKS